jgi:hypothetical protein
MIHVDGPPGAGVAQLARRLADDLHFRLEVSRPTGDDLALLLRREATLGDHVVQAYGYHTVHACAKAFQNRTYREPLARWELRLLDRAAATQGGLLIYASSRPEELEALADPREKRDEFTRTLCQKRDGLLSGYAEALEWSTLPRVVLDGPRLTEDDYRRTLDWVRGELHRRQAELRHLHHYRSSGRVQRPTAALVGERYPEQGLDVRDQPGARAFLRATGSSWTLHRALSAAGLDDAYICNAYRSGDEVADLFALRQELEAVDPRAIVALGGAAGRALRRLRIPHTEVEHPAHQRKFNASAFGAYVKRLAAAVSDPPEWPPLHLLAEL